MKRALWAAAVCGSLVAGCKEDHSGGASGGSGASGTTAVVDIDRVAKDLGWLNQMQSNQQTYLNQLKNEFQQYNQHYEQLVQEKAKSMIPPGTKEGEKYTLSSVQAQELTNYMTQERQLLSQLNQEATQLFNNYKLQWVRQYRESLSPIVRQVAQDRKMNVVLMQNEGVLFADRSVDLTDAVVDAARSRPPSLTQVPMDHLQGPADIRPNQGPMAQTQPATSQPTTQP